MVFGHSYVSESVPEDGAEVDVVEEINLTFNAGIENVSTATVIGEQGEIDGRVEVNSPVLTIYFDEALPPGSYEVQWQALGEDTHTTEGILSFHVAETEEEVEIVEETIEEVPNQAIEEEADQENEGVIEQEEITEELFEEDEVGESKEDGNFAILFIGLAVLVAIIVIVLLTKRRRS